MTANWKDVAHKTHEGARSGRITFPEAVRMLMDAGFDGYAVDFRRNLQTFYRPGGEVLELPTEDVGKPVADKFDAAVVRSAIGEAQALVPGYTYKGFCAKVVGAGCAGYLVSILGKRVLYYGRTGETHTEYFPGAR